ncbi:Fic family protein [Halocynthiibacter sp.]|uniref:Fic family protein n=1 Tax=Halocynthiibacter sp. TaxID=1979210 RepID=UPI003C693D77
MKHIWASPHWPDFRYDRLAVEAPLAAAMEAVGEVNGLMSGLDAGQKNALDLSHRVQEAIASFGIEGVQLEARDVEASVIASMKYRGAADITRRSDAVAQLMLAARDLAAPMTAEILGDWHRLLFFGIEVEDPGQWRRFDIDIVRSAVAGSDDVLYKAPPPDRVALEMEQFLDWLNTDRAMSAPVKAAIGHLWFESVHPFSDGNGRIGRALIEYTFAGVRALPFSLSRQIERDKKGYYAALQAGRQEGQGGIDAGPFIVWFLQTLKDAADHARDEALFLIRRNQFFQTYAQVLNARQDKVLRLVFAGGADRVAQGISAKGYRKMSGASAATVSRDLAALENAGIASRSEAGGRSTRYQIRY